MNHAQETTTQTMTAKIMEDVAVGDLLEWTLDVVAFTGMTELKPGARFAAYEIIEVDDLVFDVHGKPLRAVKVATGTGNGTMGLCLHEGHADLRISKAPACGVDG
tara:strand:+ start:141 stop:455 length:315 start_codon:yes stop_codon:yes gene_type:complete